MRSSLMNIWYGGEEEQLNRIFMDFLRTPGNHPALEKWLLAAQGEPLTLLYDIWVEANKLPDQAYQYVDMFMETYNVLVGQDMAGQATGAELFYSDLTELCEAVDTWLLTGKLTQAQTGLAMASSDFYRSNGGINPGAVNVIRGWFELLQVVQDNKRIIRCIAEDCPKLLVITPDADLLSGTVDGYHNTDCLMSHTSGGQEEELQLQQLPGAEQLQETVGPITQEQNNVDTPEAT